MASRYAPINMARLSLTQRSQLFMGCAAALAIAGAMTAPWIQIRASVVAEEWRSMREVAQVWAKAPDPLTPNFRFVRGADAQAAAGDPFLSGALESFTRDPAQYDHYELQLGASPPLSRYARALRGDQADRVAAGESIALDAPDAAWQKLPLTGVFSIERSGAAPARQILQDRLYLLIGGGLAWIGILFAVRLLVVRRYLRAVRRLRDVANRVRAGDLSSRSQLRTGDELEELGNAFNAMVATLDASQTQLQSINQSLDLKLVELSEANVGLFESNRLKSEFLANVSHELRTPLNSVIGFAELLADLARADPAADPKRLRYIEHILKSGRGLLEMINELLDMAKIEAGRMELSVSNASISDMLEGISAIMRPQADLKGIAIEIQRPEELPTVETDPGKLQQILYNFVSNAIKFSPEKSVVAVRAEPWAFDGAPGLRLTVVDRGPGVPLDMQQTIFEKFRQVDASHTKRHAGTGLGLAICRELANMLGARLGVESKPNQGSSFWVEMPLVFRAKKLPPLMADHAG
jgi:signal transduction histidine kinase